MGKKEFKVLALFKRYLTWVNDNNLEDNINNYIFYVDNIERILNKS